jgi:hypothetical protein
MKNLLNRIGILAIAGLLASGNVNAQGFNQERMDRDIEVAENVLSTLIRQQFNRNSYHHIEVKASYTAGFGVTMRMPNDNSSFVYSVDNLKGAAVLAPTPPARGRNGSSYSYSTDGTSVVIVDGDKVKTFKALNKDSLRAVYYDKVIAASKDFLADYGDLFSQLPANEKILITNRGEGVYHYWDRKSQKRMMVTVEATKGDIQQGKEGKITRKQLLEKIKVVNTESTDEVATDLELLSSIFSRLYRSDLSKSYYIDGNVYYERLKSFGVIYYLEVVSSSEVEKGRFRMPTVDAKDRTQEERNNQVVLLYPVFEKDVKENIVEYGKTIKSLADDEMVMFNVKLTRCEACGIPASLEMSIKNSVLKDYAAGKVSKEAAIGSIAVKMGPKQ